MRLMAKAAVFYGPGRISIDKKEFHYATRNNDFFINKDLEGTVLKVRSCCVCGYDARVFRSGHKKVKPPLVLGHEICAETMKDLPSMKAGTRVAVYPILPCLQCIFCRRKMYNLCSNKREMGSSLDGGFAEYIHIPKGILQIGGLVPIPEGLSDEEASLIEPLACCLNGISQITRNRISSYRKRVPPENEEESVAIIGDGPMGLIHLQLFKNLFGTKPIMIGKIPNRLDFARSVGAERTFLFKEVDDVISEALPWSEDSEGYSIIIVAASEPTALQLATRIASKGSSISLFAGFPENGLMTANSLNPNLIHYNQLSITGSFSSTPKHFHHAIEIASEKVVDLSKLITNRYSLDSIKEAISLTQDYRGLRASVIP